MGDEEKIESVEEESGSSAKAAASTSSGLSKIIKILLYVVGGILLILLVIGISYLVSKYVQERNYQRDQDVVVAPPPPPLTSFDLPEFSVTTNDTEPHFIKLKVALGFELNPEISSELIARTPQLQHMVNIILRGKSFEDLDSVEDSVALSEEIKAHVNQVLVAGKVKEVYFREFVVN